MSAAHRRIISRTCYIQGFSVKLFDTTFLIKPSFAMPFSYLRLLCPSTNASQQTDRGNGVRNETQGNHAPVSYATITGILHFLEFLYLYVLLSTHVTATPKE